MVRGSMERGGGAHALLGSPSRAALARQHTQAGVQALTLGARGREAAAILVSRGADAGEDAGTVWGAISTESS